MRVLRVLTRANLGGPARQCAALHRALAAHGVDSLLVVGPCPTDEAPFDLERAGVPRLSWAAAVAAGTGARGFVELGDLRQGLSPWADRRAVRALRELITAFGPDVVHTHTSKAGLIGRRAARRAPVVVAHHFHGHVLRDYFDPLRSAWLRWHERRLSRDTDLLFAVSPTCADELAALGVAPRSRFEVLPPAVELAPPGPGAREAARARLGLRPDQFAVASVGRLVPIKRFDHFAAMLRALPQVVGFALGDGPLRARLAGDSPANLQWLGAVPDASALLPGFDALVLCGRREGCPLVALEAFAARVPVIGYEVPGVIDALRTWGRGELVPDALGPDGLAAAVARLRAAGPDASALSAAAAGLGRFSPAAVAGRLAEVYAQARDLRAGRGYDARRAN